MAIVVTMPTVVGHGANKNIFFQHLCNFAGQTHLRDLEVNTPVWHFYVDAYQDHRNYFLRSTKRRLSKQQFDKSDNSHETVMYF